MKNIFIKSLLILAAAAASVGCIEETFPQGATQTQAQVSKSPTAIASMLASLPSAMTSTNAGGYMGQYGWHGDFGISAIHLIYDMMLEDMAVLGDPDYNHFDPFMSCEAMDSRYIYCAYFWDCYYMWIKICNDVISLIPEEGSSPESLDMLAQAYAYRATFYLDLARLFEPKENDYIDVSNILGLTVPIITENTKEAEATNNPRAQREDMYAFILSDLGKAAQYIDPLATSYDRITIHAVNGLFARAYLEMGAAGDEGAYDKAASYARKVIDESGKLPLTQEQWEDPVNGFNSGASNSSWIWGLRTSSENLNNICTYISHISGEAQWGYSTRIQLGASKRFYEQISDKDFRKHSWLDPRREEYYAYQYAGSDAEIYDFLNGNTNNPAALDYQAIKFRPMQGNVTNNTVGNAADHNMMRIEEMYFIEIEALAKDGKLNDAAQLLNSFMANRITDGSYDCSNYTVDTEAFIDEMLFQKRAEFWGEGVLMFDYKRLDRGITRGYEGTNHALVHAINCTGRSPQWNMVITRAEFQSNTAITDDLNNPDPSQFVPLWVPED